MRKTTHVSLLGCLIVLAQFNAVYASYFQTGNSLMEGWHASKRIVEYNEKQGDVPLASRFMGYVTGIADVAFYIPTTATAGQLLDIVGRYLDSHPGERHEPGAVLVVRALRTVFPSRK
jgi:hypothetical protein